MYIFDTIKIINSWLIVTIITTIIFDENVLNFSQI